MINRKEMQMDIILPFILDDGFSKGVYINADKTISDVLACHSYPHIVESVVSQAIVLTLALSANLKFNGTFSLNIRGGGPIQTIFVSATNDKKVRAYAVYDADTLPKQSDLLTNKQLFGNGELLFSVSQIGQEPYQGIIQLTQDSLVETISDYFRQSEQIKTNLVLRQQGNCVRCLLLQQMPLKQDMDIEQANDIWETENVLLESVRNAELFDDNLTPQEILYRLFHANTATVFNGQTPEFSCPCHRSQMEKFLKKMSDEEREPLYQDGKIITECQFCQNQFTFTKEDF